MSFDPFLGGGPFTPRIARLRVESGGALGGADLDATREAG